MQNSESSVYTSSVFLAGKGNTCLGKSFFWASICCLLMFFFWGCIPSMQVRQAVRKSTVFNRHFTGFILMDLSRQKIVYQQNSDKYFVPASNTKLLTFYTALKILGDSIPALKYALQNDTMYFWGTGDPSFLHPDFVTTVAYDFLKNCTQPLVYLTTPLKIQSLGTGWAWDDYNDYYSVEKAAMPMYGNIMRFRASTEIWQVRPPFFKNYWVEKPRLDGVLPTIKAPFVRDPISNLFTWSGSATNGSQDVPFRYTEPLLTQMLTDTLHKPIRLQTYRPLVATGSLYSLPVDSVYKRLLQESDNFLAEQLLLLCASRFSDTLSTEKMIAYASQNLLTDLPDKPVWKDGSGLSRYNLCTPRSMSKLLQKIYTSLPQERLFSVLPIGGKAGTIKNAYASEPPFVFAKTGSLSNVHCLSGYVRTHTGKVMLFSFMHNNYTVSSKELKLEMDKVLRLIQREY